MAKSKKSNFNPWMYNKALKAEKERDALMIEKLQAELEAAKANNKTSTKGRSKTKTEVEPSSKEVLEGGKKKLQQQATDKAQARETARKAREEAQKEAKKESAQKKLSKANVEAPKQQENITVENSPENPGAGTTVDTNKKAEPVKTESVKTETTEPKTKTGTVNSLKTGIQTKSSGMLSGLFGNLYKTNKHGRNAAVSAFSRKPMEDALSNLQGNSKITWDAYNGMSAKDRAAFMQTNKLQNEEAVKRLVLGNQYDTIMNDAQAKAQSVLDSGAWNPGENRELTKQVMGDWFANNKLRALGYGTGIATNFAGLTDNDKFGGQLMGAGLGGALSYFGHTPGGIGTVPMMLIGGSIGSLFDKLRAKREQNNQYYR